MPQEEKNTIREGDVDMDSIPFRQDLFAFQGASFKCRIVLKNERDATLYLSEGDKIIFGIRPHYSDNCIIQRVITFEDEVNGTYPIDVTPEEMEIEPDEYKYDISLQTSDGELYKIVPESSFNVLNSSTHKQS